MLKYKYVQTANGRDMYFKNGKMVGKAEIPLSVLNMLEPGVELKMPSPGESEDSEETIDDAPDTTLKLGKCEDRTTCIFCGEPADKVRYINGQNVKLCSKDYDSHTTGEIAAQMREVEKED